MKGKFTISRMLQRWRIALGCMPWWKYTVLLLVATFAVKLLAQLLLRVTSAPDAPGAAPGGVSSIGWLVTVVVAPLLETLVAQALVIWVVRKALPKSFLWAVVFSAVVFSCGLQISSSVVGTLLIGGIWAFGYLSRFEQKGFASAFWLTVLVHVLTNSTDFFI